MWIDDCCSVSWLFDAIVVCVESERLEGVDIALGARIFWWSCEWLGESQWIGPVCLFCIGDTDRL